MKEKLISGYTAYTTAEELGAAAVGDAPATTPFIGLSIAAFTAGSLLSYYGTC